MSPLNKVLVAAVTVLSILVIIMSAWLVPKAPASPSPAQRTPSLAAEAPTAAPALSSPAPVRAPAPSSTPASPSSAPSPEPSDFTLPEIDPASFPFLPFAPVALTEKTEVPAPPPPPKQKAASTSSSTSPAAPPIVPTSTTPSVATSTPTSTITITTATSTTPTSPATSTASSSATSSATSTPPVVASSSNPRAFTITGSNFCGNNPGSSVIFIRGYPLVNDATVPPVLISSWSDTKVNFTAPDSVPPGTYSVIIRGYRDTEPKGYCAEVTSSSFRITVP